MRRNVARVLLILTALWLPLQAVAGMTMKLCAHGAAVQAAQAAAEDACPYHQHETAPAAQGQPADDCEHCGICHLAASGYMPAAELVAAVVPAPQVFQPAPVVARASHIPEPPQQPPRRRGA